MIYRLYKHKTLQWRLFLVITVTDFYTISTYRLFEKGGILEIWCSWFCVAQQDRQLLKNYYYKCHLEFVSMACGKIKNQTRLTCKVKFDGNSIDLMKAEDDY